jgi:hypothetical protein
MRKEDKTYALNFLVAPWSQELQLENLTNMFCAYFLFSKFYNYITK